MGTCSMCRKEVEEFTDQLENGKLICPECANKVTELLESNDPVVLRKAVNYIYTCAKSTSDKAVSDYLFTLLEDNASDVETLEQIKKEKAPVDFQKQTDYLEDKKNKEESAPSFGGKFMKTVAWILWIGGFIVSIIMAVRTEYVTPANYTKEVFEFGIFLLMLSIYFFAGAFAMCLAELFENVHTIKNEICQNNQKNK